MDFEKLKDPALQEKLKSAKSVEELVALAKSEGIELTEDQLQGVSGGGIWDICGDYRGEELDPDPGWN